MSLFYVFRPERLQLVETGHAPSLHPTKPTVIDSISASASPRQYFGGNHNKRLRGVVGELRFEAAAIERGFVALRPSGDCERFDYGVIAKRALRTRKFARVQVRACFKLGKRNPNNRAHWNFTLWRGAPKKRPYRSSDFEFFALYIAPVDTWYIIPFKALRGRGCIFFYPTKDGPHSRQFQQYLERWDLLG